MSASSSSFFLSGVPSSASVECSFIVLRNHPRPEKRQREYVVARSIKSTARGVQKRVSTDRIAPMVLLSVVRQTVDTRVKEIDLELL